VAEIYCEEAMEALRKCEESARLSGERALGKAKLERELALRELKDLKEAGGTATGQLETPFDPPLQKFPLLEFDADEAEHTVLLAKADCANHRLQRRAHITRVRYLRSWAMVASSWRRGHNCPMSAVDMLPTV